MTRITKGFSENKDPLIKTFC